MMDNQINQPKSRIEVKREKRERKQAARRARIARELANAADRQSRMRETAGDVAWRIIEVL